MGPSGTAFPPAVTRCVAGSSASAPASERLLRRLRRTPPQHRLDPRLQLARRERLGHVVVDPRLEAGDLVRLVGARRDHDDRQLARARRRRAAPSPAPGPTCPAASSRAAAGPAAPSLSSRCADSASAATRTSYPASTRLTLSSSRIAGSSSTTRIVTVPPRCGWRRGAHSPATSARIWSADACRTSMPLTTCTTASAMFFAWSPMRSIDFAMNTISSAAVIVRGSSIM